MMRREAICAAVATMAAPAFGLGGLPAVGQPAKPAGIDQREDGGDDCLPFSVGSEVVGGDAAERFQVVEGHRGRSDVAQGFHVGGVRKGGAARAIQHR
jgi:hypothetical protein